MFFLPPVISRTPAFRFYNLSDMGMTGHARFRERAGFPGFFEFPGNAGFSFDIRLLGRLLGGL
jgi:hypothetical protein